MEPEKTNGRGLGPATAQDGVRKDAANDTLSAPAANAGDAISEGDLRQALTDLLDAQVSDQATDPAIALVVKYAAPPAGWKRRTGCRKFKSVDKAVEWVRGIATDATPENPPNFYSVANATGSEARIWNADKSQRVPASNGIGNPPVEDPARGEILRLSFLLIDVDPKGDDVMTSIDRKLVRQALRDLDVPLWHVLDSGRGVQAMVQFAEPEPNTVPSLRLYKATGKALYARLAELLPGVPVEIDAVQNANRQSRLPGTRNWKTRRIASYLDRPCERAAPLPELANRLGVSCDRSALEGPRTSAIDTGKIFFDERIRELLSAGDWQPNDWQGSLIRRVGESGEPDLGKLRENGRLWLETVVWEEKKGKRSEQAEQVAQALLTQGEAIEGVLAALEASPHCNDQSDPGRARWRCLAAAVRGSKWEASVYGSSECSSEQQPKSEPPILDKWNPYESAETFLKAEQPHLMFYNGDYLVYEHVHYRDIEEGAVRAQLYDFADRALQPVWNEDKKRFDYRPFCPDSTKINKIMDAIRARAHVERDRYQPPCWLQGEGEPADELIACRNGLLRFTTSELLPLTPRFFTRNALDFDYDPNAPQPVEWFKFLDSLWGDQRDLIDLLQETFGYLATPDTRQQKAFLLIGPPRSGNGTIGHVLSELVGRANVCAPNLPSLAKNFGLQPLIGKQLAIISDLRMGRGTDKAAITENLLRITGEDTVTADRKYKAEWTGKLGVRFLVMTNVMPAFGELSGALANRFIPLPMTRSFLGNEDQDLRERLLAELPGILNWALEGLRRFRKRGHFALPEMSLEVQHAFARAGNDVLDFVEECCVLDPDASVAKEVLFNRWTAWCAPNGLRAGAKNAFAQKLLDTFQGKVDKGKVRRGADRVPVFRGIRLRDGDAPDGRSF